MPEMREVLQKLRTQKPQTKMDVIRGLAVRLTENQIPVISVHYTADPDRDPELNPDWKIAARKGYSSQAAWDREQEIIDEAGGGELVFAETMRTHWNKVIITDPAWKPGPYWKVLAGFDHGKTNPTSLERAYVDHDGRIFICGEYYMPGKSVWQKAPDMLQMPDIDKLECCYADPSIFTQKNQEERGQEAKAISEVYYEEGVKFLRPFEGNRNDLTFAERVLAHWGDLEHRDPTLFIVCRNVSEKPQPGLHPWDCPNLIWEMLRARKTKLTALQLLNRNPSEQIVDKDNHATDAMKYLVMSLPAPSVVPLHVQLAGLTKNLDPTNAMITKAKFKEEVAKRNAPVFVGGKAKLKQMQYLRNKRGGSTF